MQTEFLYISVLRVASRPRVKLASCKSALNPLMVYSSDRSKAVVPVLVLLFIALWYILLGDLSYVLPCIILFLCFSVLLEITSLGEERANLSAFLCLFDLCLFGFVCFPILLVSGEGCGCDCALPGLFSYLFFVILVHTIMVTKVYGALFMGLYIL